MSKIALHLFWVNYPHRRKNVKFDCGDDNSKPTRRIFIKPKSGFSERKTSACKNKNATILNKQSF